MMFKIRMAMWGIVLEVATRMMAKAKTKIVKIAQRRKDELDASSR